MARITKKQIEVMLDLVKIEAALAGVKKPEQFRVMNPNGYSTSSYKALVWLDPENGSTTQNTELGYHSWESNKEIIAGLRGIHNGLRTANNLR